MIILKDQFGKIYGTQKNTKIVLFARSQKGGDIIQKVLHADITLRGNTELVYIADISSMPRLIAQFFAIPAFKKYLFKLALDKDGMLTQTLPAKDGHATLMFFNNGELLSISYHGSQTTLLNALQ